MQTTLFKIGPHLPPTSPESPFLVLFLLLNTRITIKYIIDSFPKFIVDLAHWNGSPFHLCVFYFLMYPKLMEGCPTHSKYSVSTC